VTPGQTVTLTAMGFAPGEQVQFVGSPIGGTQTPVNADATGKAQAQYVVTCDGGAASSTSFTLLAKGLQSNLLAALPGPGPLSVNAKAATISFTPTSATPGTTTSIQVSGSGFGPTESIDLLGPGPKVNVTTDSSGAFSNQPFTLSSALQPGGYTIHASHEVSSGINKAHCSATAASTLTVSGGTTGHVMTLSPTNGNSGQSVTASIANGTFGTGTDQVTFSGSPGWSATTNASSGGIASFPLTIPLGAPGTWSVRAQDTTSNVSSQSANGPFTINSTKGLAVAPTTVAEGSSITFTGTNWVASPADTVTFSMPGVTAATAPANSAGTASWPAPSRRSLPASRRSPCRRG